MPEVPVAQWLSYRRVVGQPDSSILEWIPFQEADNKVETYSRVGLLRSYGNLQSYWTTTKLREFTVVLDYYEAKGTYSRIGLIPMYNFR